MAVSCEIKKRVRIMNPEIAKYWNEALKSFDDAKVAFKKGKSDHDIKKKLSMAICHGQIMTRHLKTGGEEHLISVETAVKSMDNLEKFSIDHAFAVTLQALREYRNLVPDEYNLPLPTGLNK